MTTTPTERPKYSAEDLQAAATFMARMLPAMLEGATPEEAGKAVLARDQEIMDLTLADTDEGAEIRAALAKGIYAAVRGRKK